MGSGAAVESFRARTAAADAAWERGGASAALAALAPVEASSVVGEEALQVEAQAALRGFRLLLASGDASGASALLEGYEARSGELSAGLAGLVSLELARLDLREERLAVAIHRSLRVLQAANAAQAPDLASAAALVGGRAALGVGDLEEASRALTLGREAFRVWWGEPSWREGSPLEVEEIGESLWVQSALLALERGEEEVARGLLAELGARQGEGGALRGLVSALLQARLGLPGASSALRGVLQASDASPSVQARAMLELASQEASLGDRAGWLEAAAALVPPESGIGRQVALARIEVQLASGEVAGAFEGLEALGASSLTLGEQARAVRLRALGHLELGAWQEALGWLRLALEGDRVRGARQAEAEDHRLLASTLRRLGECSVALGHVEAAAQLLGSEPPALALERGLLGVALPDHPEASRWIAAALALEGAALGLPERGRWLLLGAWRRASRGASAAREVAALEAASSEAAACGAAGLAKVLELGAAAAAGPEGAASLAALLPRL